MSKYVGHLRTSRKERAARDFQRLQKADLEEKLAERKRVRERTEELIRGLRGTPEQLVPAASVGAHAFMPGREPDAFPTIPGRPGLLENVPEEQRAIVEAAIRSGHIGKGLTAAMKATGSKTTAAQDANNAEIVDARKHIRDKIKNIIRPGESPRDVITRLISSGSELGRANPDFDPFIRQAFGRATNRQVGKDSGYRDFLEYLDMKAPKAAEAAPKATPAATKRPDDRSTWQSVLEWFEGLGDGDKEKAARQPTGLLNQGGQGGAPPLTPEQQSKLMQQAQAAIRAGKDPEAVMQRLIELGVVAPPPGAGYVGGG
tara:strand:- start:140 stop:1087 length:948 start_codon:yes stop_codon:yes gene_type:complete